MLTEATVLSIYLYSKRVAATQTGLSHNVKTISSMRKAFKIIKQLLITSSNPTVTISCTAFTSGGGG